MVFLFKYPRTIPLAVGDKVRILCYDNNTSNLMNMFAEVVHIEYDYVNKENLCGCKTVGKYKHIHGTVDYLKNQYYINKFNI